MPAILPGQDLRVCITNNSRCSENGIVKTTVSDEMMTCI